MTSLDQQILTRDYRDTMMFPLTILEDRGQVSGFVETLPNLPTMLTTRLKLELLLRDSWVDLHAVSETILADPGATLQVLRLVGEEYGDSDNRPTRIGDCIVSLGVERCYESICESTMPHAGRFVSEWQLCHKIAEFAREFARSTEDASPDEAYLAGLLYRIGAFPQLLGWDMGHLCAHDHRALSVLLATHWKLPNCVLQATTEQLEDLCTPKWKVILLLALQAAEE